MIRNPTFQGELGDSTFLKVQSALIISIFRLIEFVDISNNYPGPRLIILVLEHRKHIISQWKFLDCWSIFTLVVENRATQDTFQSLKVNFFCHFHIPFFIFLRPKKLQIETLKSFLGRSVFHYYHFSIYILFLNLF